ncbi:hypothetical protein GN244_ATG05747 [Phytophthora infestans]|uniref:Uncharacterized protein n=1 Tax=Phytophthora infestans TaxID=4787 RepID=A0A833T1U5_PHYIN|nr:hypothetical protein GN244_ATG05747 [Phytophthora infestans]
MVGNGSSTKCSNDDPEAARYLRYEAGLDDDREIDSTGFDMQDADEDEGDFDESEPEDMDEIVWAPTQPTKYIKDLEKSTDCVDLAAASTLADTMVTNISIITSAFGNLCFDVVG